MANQDTLSLLRPRQISGFQLHNSFRNGIEHLIGSIMGETVAAATTWEVEGNDLRILRRCRSELAGPDVTRVWKAVKYDNQSINGTRSMTRRKIMQLYSIGQRQEVMRDWTVHIR